MKFNWYFTKEDFEKCKKKNAGDYVGNIRTGNLCFDIIQVEDEANMWIDCYVGGVDSGYGYGKDDYPYDYATNVGINIEKSEYTSYTYDQFVAVVEKGLTDSINEQIEYTADNGEVVNLIDKANEPLKIW